MKLIILRIAQQYSYFDAVANAMVMQTSEFGPGVSDSLVCTDEDRNIVFEGTPKDFQAWALENRSLATESAPCERPAASSPCPPG